jgi:hypothetical protein
MLCPKIKNKKLTLKKLLLMNEDVSKSKDDPHLQKITIERKTMESVFKEEKHLFSHIDSSQLFARGSKYRLESRNGIIWSLVQQLGTTSQSLGSIYLENTDNKTDTDNKPDTDLTIQVWLSIKKKQTTNPHAKVINKVKIRSPHKATFGMNESWPA